MTFRIACQYRLRGRRTFGLKPSILKNSCRGTTASFPTGCFTTWYGTCTIMHRKALGRAGAHTAQHIRAHHQKRAAQPAGEVDTQRRRRKSLRVIKDITSPRAACSPCWPLVGDTGLPGLAPPD
ncbi:unnamed protein product [Pleuronectes platessa]|uniref:Uncharacterized protein n=1 Tax=Pleuronectes platessa TaxID=8262 RepID=A0A9N7VJ78_PLEPL|nr:unnamed protein product [Pleuronectes platessa]